MEKIDIFFRKHSWLFKLGIWTLLIFWAAQGNYPFKFILADTQKDSLSNISYDEALTARRANIKLSNEILRKAREKGSNYSPRDYFVDLERLRASEKKFDDIIISHFYPHTINTLMQICRGNMWRKGKYTMEDFDIAYKEYADRAGIKPLEQIKIDWLNLTKKIWGWFFTFYTRGFLLAFLLFLVLMSERDNILKIILSDKRKFVLAVCFWPFFLHKYPANIVREIVVEAELRRIGSIFRRFTWEEKNKVRDIAKGEDYKDWIDGFRLANTGLLRPSLSLFRQ